MERGERRVSGYQQLDGRGFRWSTPMGDTGLEQRSSHRLASLAIVRKQLYARTITFVNHLVTSGQHEKIHGLAR